MPTKDAVTVGLRETSDSSCARIAISRGVFTDANEIAKSVTKGRHVV